MIDVQVLKCVDAYVPRDNVHVVIVADPEKPAAILPELLSKYLKAPPSAIQILRDEHGRKFARSSGTVPSTVPDFSVSYAAGLTAVAIAPKGRIGMDMELVKPEVDLGVAQIAFSDAEQRWLFSLPPLKQAIAFYHCWTAKEAFLKAIGLGIGIGLNQIEIKCGPDGHFELATLHSKPTMTAGWQLTHHTVEFENQKLLLAIVRA
jgi:4'-phosphopantetheinyl transferase